MAINKVVNKSAKSHGAMRNVIEYVLRSDKVKEGYVEVTGPYSHAIIDWDKVYQSFLREKHLWNKDSGRMYAHNVISFHKDEIITPETCMKIGRTFADEFFPEHQNLIGVHQDKKHLHIHIITNSVSFIDGRKLHQTKRDLERQKEFTNALCRKLGLTITEKGKHFDGSVMEEGEISAWSKDKYNLLRNETKKSFVADCAIALMDSIPESENREDFIKAMADRGWSVNWQEKRKHIVFENDQGQKVRDSNISKTFNINIGKESLLHEFERQKNLRKERIRAEQEARELDRYYAGIEAAIAGADAVIAGAEHNTRAYEDSILPPDSVGCRESREHREGIENIDALLTELDAAIQNAGDAIHYGEAQRGALNSAESDWEDRGGERRSAEQKGFEDPERTEITPPRKRSAKGL